MWATDHQGEYPKSLDELTPDCLVTIPICPVSGSGSDTYSSSYQAVDAPVCY
jgi:hypothetical protein